MELSVQNVYGLLLRSKLLSPDDARTVFDRWQKEARDGAANAGQFTRWLVANRYLTEYQAALLARGHAEGFFLNQYKVLDRLGRGRMAGVYKAVHPLGQVVAIKVLPPSKAKDPHLLARFQREARLAVRMKHPNVVRAFQVGEAQGLHYIVMEYLEGETLEDLLARRPRLPPAEAVRLVYQALLGLQHIHTQGLVHRDLKPANLMLVPAPTENTLSSTVKILDIGLARALADETVAEAGEDPGLTSEGALLGTPDYMAPEQARDARSADIRADIYSLGCVLYHALAGQPPFPDSNVISQMVRHATEAPRPLKELNPAVPDGLQQILNYLMAKDPAQRYPTPERAAQGLQVFLEAGLEATTAPEASPQLKSYLSWLDGEEGKPTTPAAPGTAPMSFEPIAPPSAKSAPAAAPARPAARPSGERVTRKPVAAADDRQRPKRRKQPPSLVTAAPAGSPPVPVAVPVEDAAPRSEPASRIDVELIEYKRPEGWELNRRDFLMMGIGGAGVLVAIFTGWGLANLFSRQEKPVATQPEPEPEPEPENP